MSVFQHGIASGDIHVCMAFELKENPFDEAEEVSAVEFINTSLTSQNLDDKMKWTPRTDSLKYEAAMMNAFPHIKWCDIDSHGSRWNTGWSIPFWSEPKM